MDLLDVALIFSILSCSLVGGFIFTYAIVVMPGLSSLSDKDFLRAFQVTDAIIQDNQPLFIFTWVGSMVAMFMMIVVSSVRVELAEAWPIVLISVAYLVGVQGITAAFHIPLNNHIQNLIIEDLNDETLADERLKFEAKWNFFNYIPNRNSPFCQLFTAHNIKFTLTKFLLSL
jgi:uncharacterized membrane protein